jgi:hypothetical protein
MTSDPKDTKQDDIIAWELTEQELEGVDGGITLDNGIKFRAKVDGVNNDTLFAGVNNDTLFAGFTGDKTFKRR